MKVPRTEKKGRTSNTNIDNASLNLHSFITYYKYYLWPFFFPGILRNISSTIPRISHFQRYSKFYQVLSHVLLSEKPKNIPATIISRCVSLYQRYKKICNAYNMLLIFFGDTPKNIPGISQHIFYNTYFHSQGYPKIYLVPSIC